MAPFLLRRAQPGMVVTDLNGQPVGTVVQADREALLIGTASGDLWISMNAVFTVEQQVTLVCNAESVRRYLTQGPRPIARRT